MTVIPFPDQSEKPGPVERLRRTLDEHLAAMADDVTRLRLLNAAEHSWTLRYCAFQRNVASGRYDETDGLTAWDYLTAICEISVRLQRLEMKLRGARP